MLTVYNLEHGNRKDYCGNRPILAALAYSPLRQLYELVWDHSSQRIPCDHERQDEIPMFTLRLSASTVTFPDDVLSLRRRTIELVHLIYWWLVLVRKGLRS